MKNIYELAGLTPCGTDADGEPQFIGTRKQWGAYENLEMAEGMVAEQEAAKPRCRNRDHWFNIIALGHCYTCNHIFSLPVKNEAHDCAREAGDPQDSCSVCDSPAAPSREETSMPF